MNAVHKITGYDKRTEALTFEHQVPADQLNTAREIAHVPSSDYDAVGSYPLDADGVRRLSLRLGQHTINTDAYDWFLEPFGN